ncbi:putative reverse transcriptase domain-containing protein [Tanacetum coccineum]
MERGFLSQKGSGGGRGVKEKRSNVSKIEVVMEGAVPSITGESGNAAMEVESPYVVEKTVEKEKLSHTKKDKLSFFDDIIVLEPFPPLSTPVSTAGNAPSNSSYANITGKPSRKKVNVHTLFTPGGNGIDVVVSADSIRTICERLANTAYGFFLGKKVAYLVVANYVRNNWGKYGLVRSMFSSSTGLLSFQFISMDRLDAMLENSPWFIQNNPLILKKWHPDENLLKEDVSNVPVWVKLHGVPVTAFSEDRLSDIATKLGTPLMLDSYTSDMCMQSWGRSSYARVMIELKADVELKDNIVVAMPKITKEVHYTCNVRVEYEWKPPRCSSCKVFRHVHEECMKNTGAGEKKTVEKPSQTSRGVPHNASSSDNKKKGVEPTIECASNTPIGAKIDKIERQIGEGKLKLLDNDENPLVPTGIVESDGEVEHVFDGTTNLRIPTSSKDGSDKGYGTNSLLEQ